MKRTLSIALISLVSIGSSAQWAQNVQPQGVPAYNAAPPPKGVTQPAILSGAQLSNFQHPVQVKAYKAAAKIPGVLHQLPCYCYCDRHAGHNSLRTCFESEHGANCSTCMKEALFAEQQTKLGKTPAQIRAAIIHGDYEKIDLVKLDSAR